MIKILSPGLYCTIQDMGRVGYRKQGVPVSGAMDQFSAELANRLVGNKPNTPLLEATLNGPTLQFLQTTQIAITGAHFTPSIDGIKIPMNSRYIVSEGGILKFYQVLYGARVYIAVAGGIMTEYVLGSASAYQGITEGAPLVKGDALATTPSIENSTEGSFSGVKVARSYFEAEEIEVFAGPEFTKLSAEIRDTLTTTHFTITSESNRMAYTLEASKDLSANEILTAPVQPGTVQLTPSGKIVVLMRDAQTTGGYARVLQLTSESVNRLAQKRARSFIRFRLISYP